MKTLELSISVAYWLDHSVTTTCCDVIPFIPQGILVRLYFMQCAFVNITLKTWHQKMSSSVTAWFTVLDCFDHALYMNAGNDNVQCSPLSRARRPKEINCCLVSLSLFFFFFFFFKFYFSSSAPSDPCIAVSFRYHTKACAIGFHPLACAENVLLRAVVAKVVLQ